MTDEELQTIIARCDAAPRGPWIIDRVSLRLVYQDDGVAPNDDNAICECWTNEPADFIAHARTDVPVLAAEVDRLRMQLAAVPVDAITVVAKLASVLALVGDVGSESEDIDVVYAWLEVQQCGREQAMEPFRA